MPTVHENDGGGHKLTLHLVDEYRLCTFGRSVEKTEHMFKELPNFKCRDDDVFICAPVKSGTHWVWEIASMLRKGAAQTIPVTKVDNMIEFMPFETFDDKLSPRTLNSHLHYSLLPREAKEKNCKIIFILRNPKDVVVSLYNHIKGINSYDYGGKWEHFLSLFLNGEIEYNSWFDYVLEWETLISQNPQMPIHLVYYEDLKENNLDEVKRIAQFLEIENKDELFEAISEKCQFKNMQKDKMATEEPLKMNKIFKEDYSMYRKGDIGDWKNWFTVAQNENFDAVYAEKMRTSKLKFRYTNKSD